MFGTNTLQGRANQCSVTFNINLIKVPLTDRSHLSITGNQEGFFNPYAERWSSAVHTVDRGSSRFQSSLLLSFSFSPSLSHCAPICFQNFKPAPYPHAAVLLCWKCSSVQVHRRFMSHKPSFIKTKVHLALLFKPFETTALQIFPSIPFVLV